MWAVCLPYREGSGRLSQAAVRDHGIPLKNQFWAELFIMVIITQKLDEIHFIWKKFNVQGNNISISTSIWLRGRPGEAHITTRWKQTAVEFKIPEVYNNMPITRAAS